MLTLIGSLATLAILGAQTSASVTPLPQGVTINSQAAYAYGSKQLPDLLFSYDPKTINFEKASPAMVEAAAVPGTWAFMGSDGKVYDEVPKLDAVPFWIYAAFADAKSAKQCRYVLVDGLIPQPYEIIPARGDIAGVEFDGAATVLRDCGHGFETVSKENYESVFDPSFGSGDLSGNEPTPEFRNDAVPAALAKDYVDRLIKAFGGKAALQSRLDVATGGASFSDLPILKTALIAAGLKIPSR